MIPPLYLEAAVLVLGIVLLLAESLVPSRSKLALAWAGIGGLSIVFVLLFFTASAPSDPANVAPYWAFYTADPLSKFFKGLALLTTIIVLILSIEYRGIVTRFIYGAQPGAGLGEFFALPVLTCAGLMWMASAIDFILIFVSLELVSISFYILVSYMRRNARSLEAGVKYLILSALSTGFLVYGITWIFGVTGQTNLHRIGTVMLETRGLEVPLLFGFALVVVALGFKIAAVPFQLWVPDVYQGAPTPVTAFLSVGSKAAGFLVLLRVLDTFARVPELSGKVLAITAILAGATLIYGNLAALPQENLKRLLAYSSIGHAGYLLVAAASLDSPMAQPAIAFYLAGYLLMTLLSFLVLIVVSNHAAGDDIVHFNGLGRRSPYLAFGMLIAMLSLAGVPFTIGFLGKALVFYAAVQQGQWVLIVIGAITVAAGFYFYLKVVRAMYWEEPSDDARIPASTLTKTTIGILAALIIVLGIYPQPVLRLLQTTPPAPLADVAP